MSLFYVHRNEIYSLLLSCDIYNEVHVKFIIIWNLFIIIIILWAINQSLFCLLFILMKFMSYNDSYFYSMTKWMIIKSYYNDH